LQARGLDGVQPPQETVEEMAQLYIQEIRRHQPTGPYYIAGYSSGGNIAYEIACQLREAGQEVGLLLVIDQPNPKSDYYTVRLSPSLLINILRNLPYRVQDFLHLRPERIVNRIANKLYYFALDVKWAFQHPGEGPRPLEIVELADYALSLPIHIQKIIELGYSSLIKFYPRPYPGKLTLIRAQGGRLLCSHDPKMGWGKYVDEVDIRVIPGAHWGLFQEPHIRDLSAMIQTCLDESQAK
jgi:thioesterase domain-containing protein